MSESKDIAKNETQLPANIPEEAWGSEGVDNQDVRIPSILMMQGLSKLVAKGKAKMGELVHSQSETVMGGPEKALLFIPILTFKTAEYSEKDGNKWIRKTKEPWDAKVHGNLEWFGVTEDMVEFRNEGVLNFYVMLESEIDEPDALPCLLRFRRTSRNAGGQLITYFKQCEMKKVPPASSTFALRTVLTENDKGSFYVFDISREKATDKKYYPKLYEWYKTMTSGANIVADEEVEEVESEEPAPY